MSQVQLLLNVISEVRSLADSLQVLADNMAESKPAEKETTVSSESIILDETVEAEKEKVTLEDVRGVLADKSRNGKTAEVKALITSFGADKLSAVNSSDYAELLKKAEVL